MRNRWLDFRIVAVGAVLFALIEVAALAQVAPGTAQRRPPPNPSTTTGAIPTGVDTGTPATSNALPLGTPIEPANTAERNEMRNRSAAARAAARPKRAPLAASTTTLSDCAEAAHESAQYERAMAQCTELTDRAQRSACFSRVAGSRSEGAAVALPGTGFLGSSASPGTTARLERGTGRSCL